MSACIYTHIHTQTHGCLVTLLQEPTSASCCNSRIKSATGGKITNYKILHFTPLEHP